jgi:2-hydroxychromene-2-carboxylate isomerase
VAPATFFYDFTSPYAYLAASRIEDLLPGATWRPISFGFVLRATQRLPWSLGPGREAGIAEIARRAETRGLPPVRYPEGWPDESYSLAPLRAALFAEERGRLVALTQALYRGIFVHAWRPDDPLLVREAAAEAGLDPDEAEEAVGRPDIKDRLRAYTEDALARGLVGVPTIAVDGELFWGDDRLEDAAALAAPSP